MGVKAAAGNGEQSAEADTSGDDYKRNSRFFPDTIYRKRPYTLDGSSSFAKFTTKKQAWKSIDSDQASNHDLISYQHDRFRHSSTKVASAY